MRLQNKIKGLRQQKRAGTLDEAGMSRLQSLRAKKKGLAGGKSFQDKGVLGKNKDLLSGVQDTAYESINNLGDSLSPIDFNALPSAPNTEDLAGERARIEGDLYNKYTSGFDTEKSTQREGLEQQLAERGINPGSGDAYSKALSDFDTRWNDRYEGARTASVEGGGQELERLFGLGQAGRADALNEQTLAKQFPLQQAQGLLGLSQGYLSPHLQNKQFNKAQNYDWQKTQYGGQLQKDLLNQQHGNQLSLAQFNVNNRPGQQAFDPAASRPLFFPQDN